MSSHSTDFFPPALKWLSLGCFTILTASFVIIYLSAPTLSLDDYVIEEDIAGYTANSHLNSNQDDSSQEATPHQPAESTNSSQTKSPSPSVLAHSQGEITAETEPEPDPDATQQSKNSEPANDQTNHRAEPRSASKNEANKSKGQSDHACRPGQKKEIIGLIRIRPTQQKVYFSPRHHPVEYKLIQKGIPDARRFCSEEEAQEHGYTLALNSYLRYYTKHLFR